MDYIWLFGYHLPKELELRILEYLDLRSLASCRMVNSQWRISVDSLGDLWSGLTRRLGIADACERGRERRRAEKMLGDCWITCSFCPMVEEFGMSMKGLKLSWVSLDIREGCYSLHVAAFDPCGLAYQKWCLQLPTDASMHWLTIDQSANPLLLATEWITILTVADHQRVASDEHSMTFRDAIGRELRLVYDEADAADIDDASSDSESTNSKNQDSDGNVTKTGTAYDPVNLDAESTDTDSLEGPINCKVTRLRNAVRRILAEERSRSRSSATLYAILPLHKPTTDSTGPVVPLALIRIASSETIIRMVVHRCNSCSETHVLLLTTSRLLLYSIPTTGEAATQPANLTTPCAFIAFAGTPETRLDDVLRPHHISATTSTLSSTSSHGGELFVVYFYSESRMKMSLQLFRVKCRDLQQLNSLQLPDNCPLIFSVNERTDSFIISTSGIRMETRGKVRMVRPFVSAQDCLELDYGPCEYYNPIQTIRWQKNFDFQSGRQFWYCIGNRCSRIALAIFRCGCPRPLLVVDLNGLVPLHYLVMEDVLENTLFTASNYWIDCGFDPDSADQTPLISMSWRDEIHLLLGWSFSPPTRPLSCRCKRVSVSRDFREDWPWIRWRRGADKEGSLSSESD